MTESVVFYCFAALATGTALATILHRNIFKSATLLAGFFFTLAALFITLNAEFLAVVQVLIYVGAITVLIVFAVMLTARMNDEQREQFNSQKWMGVVVAAGLLVLVVTFVLHSGWSSAVIDQSQTTVDTLGMIGSQLLSSYVLAFDLVTVLLLIALVGALYIARADRRFANIAKSDKVDTRESGAIESRINL